MLYAMNRDQTPPHPSPNWPAWERVLGRPLPATEKRRFAALVGRAGR